MRTQNDGYGIFRNNENGSIYTQQMTKRDFDRDMNLATPSTSEPLEFVAYIRHQGRKGVAGQVNQEATHRALNAAKKRFEQSATRKTRRKLAKAS